VKWSFMSNAFPRDWKKDETNSVPLSEVTCDGIPCLEKTCMTNSLANIGEVMVLTVGMNMPCLESLSMTTSIEL